jgi:hypothetical protein
MLQKYHYLKFINNLLILHLNSLIFLLLKNLLLHIKNIIQLLLFKFIFVCEFFLFNFVALRNRSFFSSFL